MVIRITQPLADRATRLWQLLEHATQGKIRSLTAAITACTDLGCSILEAECDKTPGLSPPRRVISAGTVSAGCYDKVLPRCEDLSRRYRPAFDSMGRCRSVSKHAVMRWAFEAGLDRFEQHFGVFGVEVHIDDRGIAAV